MLLTHCLRLIRPLVQLCNGLLIGPWIQLTCGLLVGSLVKLSGRVCVVFMCGLCCGLLVGPLVQLKVSLRRRTVDRLGCGDGLWKRLVGAILLIVQII